MVLMFITRYFPEITREITIRYVTYCGPKYTFFGPGSLSANMIIWYIKFFGLFNDFCKFDTITTLRWLNILSLKVGQTFGLSFSQQLHFLLSHYDENFHILTSLKWHLSLYHKYDVLNFYHFDCKFFIFNIKENVNP